MLSESDRGSQGATNHIISLKADCQAEEIKKYRSSTIFFYLLNLLNVCLRAREEIES